MTSVIISAFPLLLFLGLLLSGLALLWFTRKQTLGKLVTSAGVCLLIFFSLGIISETSLRPLERQYPPLNLTTSAAASLPASLATVKWVVVLGGGAWSDSQRPALSNLFAPSLARVVEAVEIYRRIPGSKLIFSGGKLGPSESEAILMARAAKLLGVAEQDILIEPESKDTETQAVNIKPLVGTDEFILVTSAWHMPRAMALFKKAGLSPIPAPANYETGTHGIRSVDLLPNPDGLTKIGIAIHEYVGLAWAKLRRKA